MKMAEIVYALCAILSSACAYLLFKGYQESKSKLLMWSCLSFCFLALNNVILFVDVVLLPTIDFGGVSWRTIAGAIAGSLLLFGLIWETT
jgi:hypothetical protein